MKPQTPFAITRNVLLKAERRMPSWDASIGDGGRDNMYGSSSQRMIQNSYCNGRGYNAVLIYVRKGLGCMEIIKPVVDAVLGIQKRGNNSWSLVPFSHGWSEGLRNADNIAGKKNRHYSSRSEKIAESLCELAGEDFEAGRCEISDLYPRSRSMKLCRGKTKVDSEDLFVFVDLDDSPWFPASNKYKIRYYVQQNMIFVRVAGDLSKAEWKIGCKEVKFEEKQTE